MVRDAVRLYFVHVPENKYFPKILFFLNKNIFKCLVVFKKIFLSVWLLCCICFWKLIFRMFLAFHWETNIYYYWESKYINNQETKIKTKKIKKNQKSNEAWERDLSERERERERSAAASGGLRNGFAEWVRRSGGFDEWVRRSGGFVGVGLRNVFSGFLGFGNGGDDSPVLWALLDERAWSWVGRGRDRFWVDRSWVVTI